MDSRWGREDARLVGDLSQTSGRDQKSNKITEDGDQNHWQLTDSSCQLCTYTLI